MFAVKGAALSLLALDQNFLDDDVDRRARHQVYLSAKVIDIVVLLSPDQ